MAVGISAEPKIFLPHDMYSKSDAQRKEEAEEERKKMEEKEMAERRAKIVDELTRHINYCDSLKKEN